MSRRPIRRFAIRDILVLTAAIAVGLKWMRYFQESTGGGESYPNFDESGPTKLVRDYTYLVQWWVTSLSRCVATVAIALLGLQAWGTPRRRLRTLARRPGAVAGGAILLTVAHDLAHAASEVGVGLMKGEPHDDIWVFTELTLSEDNAWVAVASAWTLLALSGRWRREPGWLDALGIGLGVFWLLDHLLAWVVACATMAGWWQ